MHLCGRPFEAERCEVHLLCDTSLADGGARTRMEGAFGSERTPQGCCRLGGLRCRGLFGVGSAPELGWVRFRSGGDFCLSRRVHSARIFQTGQKRRYQTMRFERLTYRVVQRQEGVGGARGHQTVPIGLSGPNCAISGGASASNFCGAERQREGDSCMHRVLEGAEC
jgi:hypothetical protein